MFIKKQLILHKTILLFLLCVISLCEVQAQASSLVYMSGGFDWNANYRMILVENSANAVLIPEAFVTNNSILSFSKLSLQLVEGNLNRTRHQYAKSLQRNAAIMEKAQADMSFSGAAPERDNLGDYYIYSVPNKLDIRGKESITVRLYDAREIG